MHVVYMAVGERSDSEGLGEYHIRPSIPQRQRSRMFRRWETGEPTGSATVADAHLHMFVKDQRRYTVPNPWLDDAGPYGRPRFLDARKHRIDQLLTREKDWIEYQYDFGDKWYHRIKLQKILLRDPSVRLPVCLSGKRQCPPEDSGGVWRFRHMLTVLADPDHEEYERVAEWMDPDFDPEAFSVEAVNKALRGMFG